MEQFLKKIKTKHLNRYDILALKQADHIIVTCVYTHGKPNIARIACVKHTEPDEFKTWNIYVASSIIFLDDSLICKNVSCVFTIKNSLLDWTWQTAVGLLNIKDEIEILWCPDALTTSDHIEKNLHTDIIKLVIYRREFRYHFLLGAQSAFGSEERIMQGLVKNPTKEMLV